MFMITFNVMDIIGLTLLAIFLLLLGLSSFIRWFKERSKTGWCKHDYKLDRTNSYGAKAWYKCTKCKDEKLM